MKQANPNPKIVSSPLMTPDKRYLVIKGRLWRASNPALEEKERISLVKQLMEARRQVKDAIKKNASESLKAARSAVNKTKIALGERGPPWWTDGTPDYNRRFLANSPYKDWYEQLLSKIA